MSTQPLYESDTEDNRNVISTRPATPLQQVSPSSSALSAESVWSRVSDWDPYITLMDSEKPFCTPAMYDGPGDATKSGGFYNVYVGDLPGCYRDWASAGSRVSGYPNNHHKKYKTYKDAMEGWKQYCLAHHQHSEDFVSGTVYELRAVSAPPSSIPRQSNHNVAVVPSPKKYLRESSVSAVESPLSRVTTPVKKSTRVSKSPTKPNDSRIPEHKSSPSKLTSLSFSISSPSSLSSASFSHAAAAGPSHYLGSQPTRSCRTFAKHFEKYPRKLLEVTRLSFGGSNDCSL
ncbi:hypothetical protein C8R42DRAFT_723288 [Lentinula raphanica]|nr:hypothetical protein C8R42DRAFT_723288 [Lentinula raphanica]